MKLANFQRVKARSVREGDDLVIERAKGEAVYHAEKVLAVAKATKKLNGTERQTPAHRMKIKTEGKTYQVLPTADIFILAREEKQAPRRGRPPLKKAPRRGRPPGKAKHTASTTQLAS